MIVFLSKHLLKLIPLIQTISIDKFELCLTIPSKKLIPILFFLRDHTHTQYKILSEICVIDFPTKLNRFEIIYNLLSIKFNSRLKVKVTCHELETIPTIISVFKNANWWEREIFDMFGIFFFEHPDLRRLLNDYGFEGYPLRKDFPLNGFIEVRYNELKKRVVYEPTNLTQDYRVFNFENPW